MPDLTQPATSLAYVHVPIRDLISGAVLSGDSVEMAFPAAGAAPASGDWKPATWLTVTATTPDTYYARCLVGPAGTVTLTAGSYDVWVRVTDSPEVPVLRAPGQLVIT